VDAYQVWVLIPSKDLLIVVYLSI